MIRQGYLFQKIVDIENLKQAIWNASKKKRSRRSVRRILDDVDFYALKLQNMLINNEFTPTISTVKIINCAKQGKHRTVYVAPFYPDLCVQWAVIQVIEQPILSKGMYRYSCGSIPGRGISDARRTIEKWVQKDTMYTKYCLQVDIHKFFPSINCGILKNMFRKHIKDYNTLRLIENIIDVQDKGVPMGFFTAPWFANFYLQEFDHFVKEQLRVKYYIRYTDDMLFFGNNKKKLHKVLNVVVDYLNSIGLEVNDNWQVYKVNSRPVDFVGYRYFRDHTEIRKKTSLRFKRRVKKASKKTSWNYKDATAVMSYRGYTKHCNCRLFYRKNIQPYINIKTLKEVISNESRKRNQTACLRC